MRAAYIPISRLLPHGRADDFLVSIDGDREVAWREFALRAGGIARALATRPERRWLIHCENPLNFACGLLAVLHAGGSAVVAPGLQPGMVAQLRPAYDAIIGESASVHLNVNMTGPAAFAFAPVQFRAGQISLFTSGSSGTPKEVPKSLIQLEREAGVLESCWGQAAAHSMVVATVPHHHIYGILFRLFWPLSAGMTFDTTLCADPPLLLERLRRAGNAILVSSPAHLTRLPEIMPLTHLKPAARMIFSSGGPLPAATAAEFERQLGAPPTEVYGSTESGGIAWRRQTAGENGGAWRPFPGMALRLDDEGALCVRSPYLADEQWLTMGDGARLLQDGQFTLQGRLDRVVKIEGKRASLPEIEQGLREHPRVLEAAVLPLTGRKQALGAVVVLSDAAQLRGEERRALIAALRAFLLERFERVLVPRQWRFVPRLPTDERGKLTAAGLAALFAHKPDDPPAA